FPRITPAPSRRGGRGGRDGRGHGGIIEPSQLRNPEAEVNGMATTATQATQQEQLQQLLAGLTAVRGGDFGTRLPDVRDPLMNEIAAVFNAMNEQLAVFTSEVTRVAREVGVDGKLGGQAQVPAVSGTWKDLTDSVNAMAGNLTGQVRNIAQVTTAVARGDLSQKISVEAKGEVATLAETIN